MNLKPHHIAFTVKDTEKSILWFQEKLGFEVFHRNNKHGMEITQLKSGDVKIELFSYGESTKDLPDYRKDLMEDLHVIGTKHLCIEVENLDATIEQLKAKGVKEIREVDTAGFGGRYTFIKDPNGILIELYQA